jgi:hypothetical protein
MTAASKDGSLWKLHSRDHSACQARFPWREADVFWEVMGKRTRRTRRGMGPSSYARIAEIMPGRAISQQGLAATCKDPLSKGNRGGGRDLVWRMSLYERGRRGNALRGDLEVALERVTPGPGKGALGTWRSRGPVPYLGTEPGENGVRSEARDRQTTEARGACEPALKPRFPWEGLVTGKCVQSQGQNRTREIRPSGIAGRLPES